MDVMMNAVTSTPDEEEERPPIPSGTLCTVAELLDANAAPGTSVSVCGRVSDYDSTVDSFVLLPPYTRDTTPRDHPRHASPKVVVTTRLLPQFKFRAGELVDVIGELQDEAAPRPGAKVVVRARVMRSAEGRDVDLFARALDVRRKFLQAMRLPGAALAGTHRASSREAHTGAGGRGVGAGSGGAEASATSAAGGTMLPPPPPAMTG